MSDTKKNKWDLSRIVAIKIENITRPINSDILLREAPQNSGYWQRYQMTAYGRKQTPRQFGPEKLRE